MLAACPIEAVDKTKRIRRVGLSAAIRGRICTDEAAGDRDTGRGSLAGDTGVCDAARYVEREICKIQAVYRRGRTVDAGLSAVVTDLELIDQRTVLVQYRL